jgi:hypothetical protein
MEVSLAQKHCEGSTSFIIYLAKVLCLSYSCHIPVVLSVVVAERWAILYVLVIKLTKETRRGVSRGREERWREKRWRA